MDLSNVTAYNMLGIMPPKTGTGAVTGAGAGLPTTSHVMGDGGAAPWSPDSPHFWTMAILAATVFGVLGASLDLRAGKRHARVSVGDKK